MIPPEKLRSSAVPLIPFLFSLTLSMSTAGSGVFWQDSGFYLTGIHEMSVPASHGFVLYLLLAKAWALILAPLAGFTFSVHLFSSVCAAGAAAFLSMAARRFLLRIHPDRAPEGPAIAAALVASA